MEEIRQIALNLVKTDFNFLCLISQWPGYRYQARIHILRSMFQKDHARMDLEEEESISGHERSEVMEGFNSNLPSTPPWVQKRLQLQQPAPSPSPVTTNATTPSNLQPGEITGTYMLSTNVMWDDDNDSAMDNLPASTTAVGGGISNNIAHAQHLYAMRPQAQPSLSYHGQFDLSSSDSEELSEDSSQDGEEAQSQPEGHISQSPAAVEATENNPGPREGSTLDAESKYCFTCASVFLSYTVSYALGYITGNLSESEKVLWKGILSDMVAAVQTTPHGQRENMLTLYRENLQLTNRAMNIGQSLGSSAAPVTAQGAVGTRRGLKRKASVLDTSP